MAEQNGTQKRGGQAPPCTMVIFGTSGDLTRRLLMPAIYNLAKDGRLSDEAWASSALSLARKHKAPVAPMHLSGPSSNLFHLFDRFSTELRDVTLFHELLNKRHMRYSLRVGPLIAPEALDADVAAATAAMKIYVEKVLPAEFDRRLS